MPEFYVKELQAWPTVHTCQEGEEVFPGITAHLAPGHTPGCLVFVLKGTEHDVIFTGDAAKNRAELISRKVDASIDEAVSAASIETIWKLWRAVAGTVVVPGHDLSMRLDEQGQPVYVGSRKVGITAWFGETLEDTTTFDMSGCAG